VDKTFTEATITSLFGESETNRIEAYVSAMQAYIDEHPSEYVEFRLGGGLLAMAKAINDGTRDAYRRTLLLSIVAVFVAGTVVLRSIFVSLVVTLTVGVGQALFLLLLTLAGWPVSLAVVPAVVVGSGIGAVFGLALIRTRTEGGGVVLFLGILAFGSLAPWFFLGLKFQADMALYLGTTALLQAISAVLFVPVTVGKESAKGIEK
jgi:hypothetical protein